MNATLLTPPVRVTSPNVSTDAVDMEAEFFHNYSRKFGSGSLTITAYCPDAEVWLKENLQDLAFVKTVHSAEGRVFVVELNTSNLGYAANMLKNALRVGYRTYVRRTVRASIRVQQLEQY
jgi:hypothetical protein